MKSYSHLVSTDNKGFASFRFEREMNPGLHPGEVCARFKSIFNQENCEAFGTVVSFSRKMIYSKWHCIVVWQSCEILNNTSHNNNWVIIHRYYHQHNFVGIWYLSLGTKSYQLVTICNINLDKLITRSPNVISDFFLMISNVHMKLCFTSKLWL